MSEQVLINKVSFEYVLPSGQTIDVIAQGHIVDEQEVCDLILNFFDMEGEPIEVIFHQEVFEDIEQEAIFHFISLNQEVISVDTFINNSNKLGSKYDVK